MPQQYEADTYVIENAGTLVVVGIGVEVVNTNGVDSKNLHQSGVSQAGVRVAKRVAIAGVSRAATRLVSHADNLKLLAGGAVDEVGPLDLHLGDSRHERSRKGHDGGRELDVKGQHHIREAFSTCQSGPKLRNGFCEAETKLASGRTALIRISWQIQSTSLSSMLRLMR